MKDQHEIQQVLWLAAIDIVNGVWRNRQVVVTIPLGGNFGHHAENAFYDVVNVCEAAATVAVVVNLDDVAFQQLIREPYIYSFNLTLVLLRFLS